MIKVETNGIPVDLDPNNFEYTMVADKYKKLEIGFECKGKNGEIRKLIFLATVNKEDYAWMVENDIVP